MRPDRIRSRPSHAGITPRRSGQLANHHARDETDSRYDDIRDAASPTVIAPCTIRFQGIARGAGKYDRRVHAMKIGRLGPFPE